VKYFLIPAAVLALLLGAALRSASAVSGAAEPWRAALAEAADAAEREDWDGAARLVRDTRADWDAHRALLHIVTAHDELEAADALFIAAESFAAERDAAEFRAAAAQLDAQLRIVAEVQALTLRNLL